MGIEMTHHDFLKHVFEQVGLVVALGENFHGGAELGILRGQRQIHERKSYLRRKALDLRPDFFGLVAHRVGSSSAEFFELFLLRRCVCAEKKRAD